MIILLTNGNFYVLTDFSMIALHLIVVAMLLSTYLYDRQARYSNIISILHTNPERQLFSAYYEETNAQNN